MRVLSVDWDYFIDADAELRGRTFPDGGVYVNDIEEFIWSQYYANDKTKVDLTRITSANVNDLTRWLTRFGSCIKLACVCNAHEYCYNFVKNHLGANEPLELINVDFHHDIYQNSLSKLNSGNWLYFLMQERPDGKYGWVSRKTSQLSENGSLVKIKRVNLQAALSVPYDYFFLCKSGLWSPPHLDVEFAELVLKLQEYTKILIEQNILLDRYLDMQPMIEQMMKANSDIMTKYTTNRK
jgi:hypothetical protein